MALGRAILATRQDAVVAPHSEQAVTCKRTSFQCKVIHIPQGDLYRTARLACATAGTTPSSAGAATMAHRARSAPESAPRRLQVRGGRARAA
jgi:hypothetical protein